MPATGLVSFWLLTVSAGSGWPVFPPAAVELLGGEGPATVRAPCPLKVAPGSAGTADEGAVLLELGEANPVVAAALCTLEHQDSSGDVFPLCLRMSGEGGGVLFHV